MIGTGWLLAAFASSTLAQDVLRPEEAFRYQTEIRGDEVLVRTARRIRSSVGADAVVVRWGGEEFLVVDRVSPGHGARIAERVRVGVAEPGDPTVTVSIGVATCTESDSGLDEVIAAADVAMYEAKALGGDRVQVATAAC